MKVKEERKEGQTFHCQFPPVHAYFSPLNKVFCRLNRCLPSMEERLSRLEAEHPSGSRTSGVGMQHMEKKSFSRKLELPEA